MLTAQFVLVNVVVAVLMKHLEDSNKEAQLEEMEERAEQQEREREREREEASRRLSVASVGGDPGPHLDAPAQVKRPNGAMSTATADADADVLCWSRGRCRWRTRRVPMATCRAWDACCLSPATTARRRCAAPPTP